MPGTPSTSAAMYVAKQATKGTAPTTGYLATVLELSSLTPRFDEAPESVEHGNRGGSTIDRPTVHKSATRRTSYAATGSFRSLMYPAGIGFWLMGAGFNPTTSGAGPSKVHAFKLANRTAVKYLSVIHDFGGRKLRAVDCRVNSLSIAANMDGIKYNGTFLGLSLGDALGTETSTDESVYQMQPSEGTCTIVYDPQGAATTIFSQSTDTATEATLDIKNGLDENDQSLWRFGRGDLAPNSFDVTGKLQGIPIDYSDYDLIVNGGGNSPSATAAVCSLAYDFTSTMDIAGDTIPYKIAISVPHAEFTIDDFAAEGDNFVRWNTTWRMIDDVADPIVITLTNLTATY